MKRIVMTMVVCVCLAAPILAQAPTTPPKPGVEHKRLEFFVGQWTFEGTEKPSPFGPGGKFSGTETSKWFPGGFFVVSQTEAKGPTGSHTGRSTMGYNPQEKVYTVHMINSAGEEVYARGNVEGKTWTFTNDGTMGGKPYKGRFTMTETSPTSYDMVFELATDGGPFQVMMEGKATKK
ncbi:MAG: DUF1579 family protein [Acidobacteriota bacterium]